MDFISFASFLSIVLVAVVVTPFDSADVTLCVIKNVTGLPCAGCGLTRAFVYLMHGNIQSAVKHNPLIIPVGLLLVLYFLRSALLAIWRIEFDVKLSAIARLTLIVASGLAVLAVWLKKLG